MICAVAIAARFEAGTAAAICVSLMKVVPTPAPSHCTSDPGKKFHPLRSRRVFPLPAKMAFGAMDVSAGTGLITMPSPVKLTVCGDPAASLTIVMKPLRLSPDAGANCTRS